ncbi:MAG TPA: metallophosphoesterase [Kofleriaceae bacterium]|nr:metallophosphoesterase [Kofleriaceae bacterium]
MWFVFLAAGLLLVTITGLYARRRLATALAELGVRARRIRIVRWAVGWLLFGFPILVFVTIFASRLLDTATLPRFDGMWASWLLAVPFVWAVLVVLQATPWLVAIDLAYLIVRRRKGLPAAVVRKRSAAERCRCPASRLRAIATLGVLGVFAIYTPVRIAVERDALRVRHHVLGASSAPPLRIAFVADVQQDVHTDGDRAREVYALVNAAKPDLVLSGGDWINTGPDAIEAAAEAAATLHSRLGTYSVRGDHEHFAYVDRDRSVAEIERAMRAHGIAMLNNEVKRFEHHGKQITIVFLNYNYIHRTDRETIAALVASVQDADYKIAVTHQLDEALVAQLEDKVDLVLAGHTHGGQVNPVVGLVHVSLARLETPYVDGRYQRGRTTILVTAGIGTSIVPIRYASPGSVEILDLAL